jgi:uroporphyrinogen decarboxylase
MTARELFLRVMDFQETRRTLSWDLGYWGGAITRWEREGLPAGMEMAGPKRGYSYGEFIAGPGLPFPMAGYDPDVLFASGISRLFELDKGPSPFLINWWYQPRFPYTVISEDEEKIEYIDKQGIHCRNFKDQKSMPLWLGHPVKNEKDWQAVKEERLTLKDLKSRLVVEDLRGYLSGLKQRDFPLVLYGSPLGFFGCVRFLIGEPDVYYFYYDKPELMHDIAEHLTGLWLAIAEEVVAMADFDACYFWEDMAGKQGALIGPALFREYMTPFYKRLIGFARSRGIRHHIVDSDGYVEELIPLFLEAGMTGMFPFEIRAGNNLERIRKKHPRLQILGGIDKTALQSKEGIDRELETVRRMMPGSGYIPFIDHGVPPDVSFENYSYLRRGLTRIVRPESAG